MNYSEDYLIFRLVNYALVKSKTWIIGYLSSCLLVSAILLFSSFKKYESPCIEEAPLVSQHTFGFTLQPTANSGLVSYWIVTVYNDKIVSKLPITEKNFILQMKGEQYSKANPQGINMFEASVESDSCFYQYYWHKGDCNFLDFYRLDDLWTLRYNRNPVCPEGCTPADGMRVDGLAVNKTYPSDAQMNMLYNYGITHYTGVFYGDNMLKMFNDINNPSWVESYRSAQ